MRTRVDRIMAIGGLLVIAVQTLVIAPTPLQFVLIFIAILVTGAGIFGLGDRLQPDRRIYLQLRAEVDDFLVLVRRINEQAVAGRGEMAAETKMAMHESIDRLAQAAGVEKTE
jgi:hypothetical protein